MPAVRCLSHPLPPIQDPPFAEAAGHQCIRLYGGSCIRAGTAGKTRLAPPSSPILTTSYGAGGFESRSSPSGGEDRERHCSSFLTQARRIGFSFALMTAMQCDANDACEAVAWHIVCRQVRCMRNERAGKLRLSYTPFVILWVRCAWPLFDCGRLANLRTTPANPAISMMVPDWVRDIAA